ncbi:MAG: 50S ribosomal protein L25/general stress protein Ctc [Saezia sp.]
MKIKATERKEQGTSASRRLRRAGNVPGIIYGNGPALAITLDHNSLWHSMRQEGAATSIIELEVDGKTSNVITRDVQYHPYKPFITHMDFQRVNMKKVIVMRVPVTLINAEESPAVKVDGYMINQIVHELEIECLPKDLPDHITIDLANLAANGSITLSQITLPKGVTAVGNISDEKDPTLVATSSAGEEEEDENTAEEAKAE